MMGTERSAGAVIFRKLPDGSIRYLLLHYEKHWGFPRGNIEEGETEEEAAKREIKEETGLHIKSFIPGFHKKIQWFYKRDGQTIFKEATFFLAETMEEKVQISHEHTGYVWAEYQTACQKITFRNAQEVIESADIFIRNIMQ